MHIQHVRMPLVSGQTRLPLQIGRPHTSSDHQEDNSPWCICAVKLCVFHLESDTQNTFLGNHQFAACSGFCSMRLQFLMAFGLNGDLSGWIKKPLPLDMNANMCIMYTEDMCGFMNLKLTFLSIGSTVNSSVVTYGQLQFVWVVVVIYLVVLVLDSISTAQRY